MECSWLGFVKAAVIKFRYMRERIELNAQYGN